MLSPALIALLTVIGQSETFHQTHAKIEANACVECHPAGPEADSLPPSGAGTHQRCDGDACHVKDFYDAKTFQTTKVCTVCHLQKTRAAKPEFVAFPPLAPSWYADLSHKRHTDSPDAKLACDVCHRAKEERVRHAPCIDCHLNQKPTMSDCSGCHHSRYDETGSPKQIDPIGMPSACRVSVAFRNKHPVHLSQSLNGRKITCDQCHVTVKSANSRSELILTQGRKTMTESCGPCHKPGGISKVSLAGDCDKCHQDACMSSFSSLPSWHFVKGGPYR